MFFNRVVKKTNRLFVFNFALILFFTFELSAQDPSNLIFEAIAKVDKSLDCSSRDVAKQEDKDFFARKKEVREERAQDGMIAEWTILSYIEGCNNLEAFFADNIQEMVRAKGSKNVNVLIQINKFKDKKTYRFKVVNGRLLDDGSLNQQMGLNPAQEIYDAVTTAMRKHPSKRFLLNLSNHGGGIHDRARRYFVMPPDQSLSENERGILYNDETGVYLTIKKLTETMERITNFFGNKITLGMDACLMAMEEIGFAVRNSVDIMIASVNVESGQGWHYREFLSRLAMEDGKMSPEELGALIVSSYQRLYAGVDPSYTLSAMRVSLLDKVKDCLDLVVQDILILKTLSQSVCYKIIETAYASTTKFVQDYADLHSFADELSNIVSKYVSVYINYKDRPNIDALLQRLNVLAFHLTNLKNSITTAVYFSVAGCDVAAARGLSIYLPNVLRKKPNPKYFACDFAQRSIWKSFLNILAERSLEDEIYLADLK